jgi:cytochrome c-type biogenesis protein CcmH
MLLWIVLAVMTGGTLAVLLRPLTRPPVPNRPRAAYDVAIYRDQLDELGRDVARGVLSEAEAGAARLEVERRLLVAVPPAAVVVAAGRPRAGRFVALATMGFVPLLALGVYLYLGSPGLPDEPLAARQAERPLLAADGSLDLVKARQGLEARLRGTPDSLEGWLLLARTDGALADWQGAKAAYDRALVLSKRSPAVLEAYGDLLVAEAQGTVTPQAEALFGEAAAGEPTSFRARYYLALAKAQQGDLATALVGWRALEREAPPEASWLGTVKEMIAQAEHEQSNAMTVGPVQSPANADAAKPAPEVSAIMGLPAEQRGDAIRSMVAGLAARLAREPNDLEGWKRLARSYRVLGEAAKSADAYAQAVALAPEDVDLLLDQAQALQATVPEDAPPPPAAIAVYRKVAALQPDQPLALWFLGLAEKQAGHKDAASAYWQRLLTQLQPNTPQAIEVKKQLDAIGAG